MSRARLRRRAARLGAAAALVAAALACSPAAKVQSGLGATEGLVVASTRPRGDLLDTVIYGADGTVALRVFAPDTPACRWVLEPERPVAWSSRGVAGRITRGDQRCDAIGIGDPFVGRLRRPRGQSAGGSPIPRAQASFTKIYEDEEVLMLRGRFPLTFHVGWAGGADTVAVVANSPVCREPAERGTASIEYRPAGRNTLALVGRGGLCRIDGLVIPPAGPRPEPEGQRPEPEPQG